MRKRNSSRDSQEASAHRYHDSVPTPSRRDSNSASHYPGTTNYKKQSQMSQQRRPDRAINERSMSSQSHGSYRAGSMRSENAQRNRQNVSNSLSNDGLRRSSNENRYQNRNVSPTGREPNSYYQKTHSNKSTSKPRILKILIPIIVAIILIGLGIFIATRLLSCDSQQNVQDTQAQEPSVSDAMKAALDTIDLTSIITAEEASSLISKAKEDSDLAYIVVHYEDFASFGEEVQAKLLRLANNDAKSISYVRGYVEKAGSTEVGEQTLGSNDSGMPYFYQWDVSWGYTPYGDATFGMNGCGPTCMAMIYVAITGDRGMTPYQMGQVISENGFVSAQYGTDADVFVWLAQNYGFNGNETYVDESQLTSMLKAGKHLIINVGPGDFTRGGHFIVVDSMNEDGTVSVHDPNSTVNSAKNWSFSQIMSQTKRAFVFW